jgi:acetylglutamate kinase
VAPQLSASEIAGLDGALTGGIVPKLEAAVAAARAGVRAEVGRTVIVA